MCATGAKAQMASKIRAKQQQTQSDPDAVASSPARASRCTTNTPHPSSIGRSLADFPHLIDPRARHPSDWRPEEDSGRRSRAAFLTIRHPLGGGVPHYPPPVDPPTNPPPPPFGRSKTFSDALRAHRLRPTIFFSSFGASKKSAPLGAGGGVDPPPASTITNKERALRTPDPRSGGVHVVDGRDNAWRSRAPGPHAHGSAAREGADGLRTEVRGQQKQSNDPHNNQHNHQYAKYWAPLTRKRHTMPHPAQPRHTNHWAPRTRKRHRQEQRPQRPTERSDPTQHPKGRPGDCSGPRKETTTRRNVTCRVPQSIASAFQVSQSLRSNPKGGSHTTPPPL